MLTFVHLNGILTAYSLFYLDMRWTSP